MPNLDIIKECFANAAFITDDHDVNDISLYSFAFSSFLGVKEYAFNSMIDIDKYIFYLDTLANIHFTPYKDLLVNIFDHDTSISTVNGSTTCKQIGIFPVVGNMHLCKGSGINGLSALLLEKQAFKVEYVSGLYYIYHIRICDKIIQLKFTRDEIGYGCSFNPEKIVQLRDLDNLNNKSYDYSNVYSTYDKCDSFKPLLSSIYKPASENKMLFNKAELTRAEDAMALYRTLGYPGPDSFRRMLSTGSITNTKFSYVDFDNAERISGIPTPYYKGSLRRKKICIKDDVVSYPVALQSGYADVFHYRGQKCLLFIAKPLGMIHVVPIVSESTDELSAALSTILDFYAQRKYNISVINVDPAGAFQSIHSDFKLKAIIQLCGTDQHVADAEVMIRVLKNKIRSIEQGLCFYLPRSMLIDLIAYSVTMLNIIPRTGNTISARVQLEGRTIHVKKLLPGGFLTFAQAHHADDSYNQGKSRAHDVLLLAPMFNDNCSWRALNLETKRVVIVSHIKVLPTPDNVITYMNNRFYEEESIFQMKKASVPDSRRNKGVIKKMKSNNMNVESIALGDDLIADAIKRYGPYENVVPGKVDQLVRRDLTEAEDESSLTEVGDSNILDSINASNINEDIATDDRPDDNTELISNGGDLVEREDWTSNKRVRKPTLDSDVWALSGIDNEELSSYAHSIIQFHEDSKDLECSYVFKMQIKHAIAQGGDAVLSAIDSELLNIIKKGVWQYLSLKDFPGLSSLRDVVPRPIPSLLDVKEKFDGFGKFLKWKARFCAGGHRQNRDDYDEEELTSPCVLLESIFSILAFAAEWGATVTVVDIGQAYLEAKLAEHDIVHMWLGKDAVKSLSRIDPGIKDFINADGRVLVKLLKALYGTIQASKLWYTKLRGVLLDYGLKQHPNDPCAFMMIKDGMKLLIGFHVDDLLIVCNDKDLKINFLKYLGSRFDLLVVHEEQQVSYLGMIIDNESIGHISINMSAYEEKILEFFPVKENKRVTSPAMDDLFDEATGDEVETLSEHDRQIFHKVVYMLLYLSKRVRFEMLMVVSHLAGRVTKANKKDARVLVVLLQFLQNFRGKKIDYVSSASSEVELYVDASFGNCSDYKGRTAVFVMFKGAVVASYCTKQKIITRNSTESEIVGLSDGVVWGLFIRSFVEWIKNDMNIPDVPEKMIVYQDNEACITMQETGQKNNIRTRHLSVRYYWPREQVQLGLIDIRHVTTDLMLADIGTKPKHGKLFHFMWRMLRGGLI